MVKKEEAMLKRKIEAYLANWKKPEGKKHDDGS